MDELEPPSPTGDSTSHLFFIGKDSHGHWVAQGRSGLCGGLFVDRTRAVRFALSENGNRSDAVIMIPGVFELEVAGRAHDPKTIHHIRIAA